MDLSCPELKVDAGRMSISPTAEVEMEAPEEETSDSDSDESLIEGSVCAFIYDTVPANTSLSVGRSLILNPNVKAVDDKENADGKSPRLIDIPSSWKKKKSKKRRSKSKRAEKVVAGGVGVDEDGDGDEGSDCVNKKMKHACATTTAASMSKEDDLGEASKSESLEEEGTGECKNVEVEIDSDDDDDDDECVPFNYDHFILSDDDQNDQLWDWNDSNYGDKEWFKMNCLRCQICLKIHDKSVEALKCFKSHGNHLRCYMCFCLIKGGQQGTQRLYSHYQRHHEKGDKPDSVKCPYCSETVLYHSASCHIIAVHFRDVLGNENEAEDRVKKIHWNEGSGANADEEGDIGSGSEEELD